MDLGYLYFATDVDYIKLESSGLAKVDTFCKSKLSKAHAVEIFNQNQQSFLAQKAAEVARSTGKSRDWWIGLQKSGESWIWHSSSKISSYTNWHKDQPISDSKHKYAYLETSYNFSWGSAHNKFVNVWPLCQVDPAAIQVSNYQI